MSIILQYCRILKNPLLAWQDQSSQLYIQIVTSDSDDVWTGSSNHTCWRRPWRATVTGLLSLCLLPTVRHLRLSGLSGSSASYSKESKHRQTPATKSGITEPLELCAKRSMYLYFLWNWVAGYLSVACLPSAWLSQGCNQLLFSKMLFLNILVIGPSVENWTT